MLTMIKDIKDTGIAMLDHTTSSTLLSTSPDISSSGTGINQLKSTWVAIERWITEESTLSTHFYY